MKQYSLTMNITLGLGQRTGTAIIIVTVNGSIEANGVTYTIESGKGLVATKRDTALFRTEGVDGQGNNVTLRLAAKYFWWGGHLYAFRGKAILQTVYKRAPAAPCGWRVVWSGFTSFIVTTSDIRSSDSIGFRNRQILS